NTTNPKVAVRWAPVEQLAFRASWGTGFRAPSLAQIGLGPSQSSQFFIDSYGCADNPVYCASTDYNLVFSGNPDLEAEESETFNVGIAWQPSNRTNVTLDYWDIKQEKKIDQVPFGFLYTEFCNVQDSTVCTRGAPLPGDTLGPLQTINTTFVNINEQSTSGLDLGATVGMDVGAGALSFGLNYTHLLDFDRVELAADGLTFVTRSLAGEYEYPEDRAMLWGDYGSAAWGVYVSVNYIGSFQDMPDADFDGTLDYDTVDTRDVGEFTTVNVQLRYTGFEGLQLLLGLDNAFDEQPPFAVGNGDDDLYGYVQSQHNPRGQFWNFKAIYRF
ncbi:MAG TPA: TonB-dependent receptor, partial [Povalibacter sp.]